MLFFCSYNMDDDSTVRWKKQLKTAKRPCYPVFKSPLTENQQGKENDNVFNADAGVENEDTMSSEDEEMDVDATRKARVDLFWKNRREKQAAAEVSWASTAFVVV